MSLFRKNNDNDEGTLNTINITPLTDCMMVLLIIFMITGSAITGSGFNIILPKAESKESLQITSVGITVTKEGEYIVNDVPVKDIELKNYLLRIKKNDSSVTIYGDEGTNYNKIMQALDAARNAGLTNVGLAVKEET